MKKKFPFDNNIFAAILLTFLLCLGFFVTFLTVNRIATNSCFKTLHDTISQLTLEIQSDVKRDREQLELIAGFLESFDDITSPEASDLLCSFEQKNTISTLGLLLPDSTLQLCNQTSFYDTSLFDFNEMKTKVPFLSGVQTSSMDSGYQYIYHAVPVIQNSEIQGILCGFVDLEVFAASYPLAFYDGFAELYIIDHATGDFIIDTWHQSLGNLKEGAFHTRTAKRGYSYNQINDDLQNKRTGSTAFFSERAQEYFYACYKPLNINEWIIMLTLPESIVFENAAQIRQVLYLLLIANAFILLAYFICILFSFKRDASKKEQRLAQTLFMLDIQQTLFDAHIKPDMINSALKKCADMMNAESSFLITLNGTQIDNLFFWSGQAETVSRNYEGIDLSVSLPCLYSQLLSCQSIVYYDLTNLQKISPKDYTSLREYGISNLIMTPVLNSDGLLAGLLSVSDYRLKQMDASLLECTAFSFLMAVNNLNSYQQIQRMGTVDLLTGLYNRNKYQYDLASYALEDILCCIYIDADGLHDLNNHLGHSAGDQMLRSVGKTLQNIFGQEQVYRIGGDEFVIFCCNDTESSIDEKLVSLENTLKKNSYHVSVGKACRSSSQSINQLISEAEQQMYRSKHRYYEENGEVGKAREMNLKLEQILLEKRDFDSFLSIISSYFLGVYVVNLQTDLTRSIYKPTYFDSMLKQNGYKFLDSIRIYADTYVVPEDRESFHAFLNYEKIEQELKSGKNPELHYRKADGSRLLIRIYLSRYFQDTQREIFWLFEAEK